MTLGLYTLRSRLCIIPQDPFVFEDTIRINIDPYSKYKDEDIWNALEVCNLKDYVSNLPDKLEHQLESEGSNLSLGQKQLFCIAGAILMRPKIMVFDESTSAVDQTSDLLIQKVIETQFADSTVISIAHRLNTIAGYDRVIVLDQGALKEMDTPRALLNDQNSLFYQLAEASGADNFRLIKDMMK